mmetsp:Transcript_26358/g.78765  ORF Transcript_26358/g.78765 Transcript_26358/m.78765 type:complete len:489 (+) Transcript_26358:216-1682(+)
MRRRMIDKMAHAARRRRAHASARRVGPWLAASGGPGRLRGGVWRLARLARPPARMRSRERHERQGGAAERQERGQGGGGHVEASDETAAGGETRRRAVPLLRHPAGLQDPRRSRRGCRRCRRCRRRQDGGPARSAAGPASAKARGGGDEPRGVRRHPRRGFGRGLPQPGRAVCRAAAAPAADAQHRGGALHAADARAAARHPGRHRAPRPYGLRADRVGQDGRVPLSCPAPDHGGARRGAGHAPARLRGAALPHPLADARAGDADPQGGAALHPALQGLLRRRVRRRRDEDTDQRARPRVPRARCDARAIGGPDRARQGAAHVDRAPRARRGGPDARHGLREGRPHHHRRHASLPPHRHVHRHLARGGPGPRLRVPHRQRARQHRLRRPLRQPPREPVRRGDGAAAQGEAAARAAQATRPVERLQQGPRLRSLQEGGCARRVDAPLRRPPVRLHPGRHVPGGAHRLARAVQEWQGAAARRDRRGGARA